jgi:hypothetical protein
MSLFVIIPTSAPSQALGTVVTQKFANKSYRLPMGEWLVSYVGTTKQLSDELGITDGTVGVSAVVLLFNGHWGRANNDIWEWISVNSIES